MRLDGGERHRLEAERAVVAVVQVPVLGDVAELAGLEAHRSHPQGDPRRRDELGVELISQQRRHRVDRQERLRGEGFTDRVERYIPPKRGRSHVMRVVTEILNARPKGRGTDIAGALDFLGHIAHRRTIAFLVSDLIASGSYERPLRTAAARHDLIPIRVTDPSEERLPDVGVALVEGLETDEVVEVDTSDPRVRAAFEARVERERAERQALFRKLRVDSVEVRTDEPYVKPLADLFRMRRRRMAGFR